MAPSKSKGSPALVILLVMVILIVVGFLIWWFMFKKDTEEETPPQPLILSLQPRMIQPPVMAPSPASVPQPVSAPASVPQPIGMPVSGPSVFSPESASVPQPIGMPVSGPSVFSPGPASVPQPVGVPVSGPSVFSPGPAPGPLTQPSPAPGPLTQPSPAPGPRTQPSPAPGPRTQPSPAPGPRTQPSPAPGPRTQPSPAPGPRTQPSPAPGPRTQPSPAPTSGPTFTLDFVGVRQALTSGGGVRSDVCWQISGVNTSSFGHNITANVTLSTYLLNRTQYVFPVKEVYAQAVQTPTTPTPAQYTFQAKIVTAAGPSATTPFVTLRQPITVNPTWTSSSLYFSDKTQNLVTGITSASAENVAGICSDGTSIYVVVGSGSGWAIREIDTRTYVIGPRKYINVSLYQSSVNMCIHGSNICICSSNNMWVFPIPTLRLAASSPTTIVQPSSKFSILFDTRVGSGRVGTSFASLDRIISDGTYLYVLSQRGMFYRFSLPASTPASTPTSTSAPTTESVQLRPDNSSGSGGYNYLDFVLANGTFYFLKGIGSTGTFNTAIYSISASSITWNVPSANPECTLVRDILSDNPVDKIVNDTSRNTLVCHPSTLFRPSGNFDYPLFEFSLDGSSMAVAPSIKFLTCNGGVTVGGISFFVGTTVARSQLSLYSTHAVSVNTPSPSPLPPISPGTTLELNSIYLNGYYQVDQVEDPASDGNDYRLFFNLDQVYNENRFVGTDSLIIEGPSVSTATGRRIYINKLISVWKPTYASSSGTRVDARISAGGSYVFNVTIQRGQDEIARGAVYVSI